RFDEEGKADVAHPVGLSAVHRGELRALNAVERQDFLGQSLVAGENESGRTRAGVAQVEKIQQRRDVGFERALPAKRLGQIEHELRLKFLQLRNHRVDRIVDRQSSRCVTVFCEGGVELVEKRVDWWIERVFAVQ